MEYYKNLSLKDIKYIDEFGVKKTEQWKDLPKKEGIYMVSNLARVKRLSRFVKRLESGFTVQEKILTQSVGKRGYLLCGANNKKNTVHQLVAMAFLNHTPCGYEIIVDHKDNNKLNCVLNNLQLITQRENASKDKINKTSKYIGVSWRKEKKIWISAIRIKGVKIPLYGGKDEEKANEIYIKAKENLYLFNGNVKEFKNKIGIVYFENKLTKQNVIAIRRLHKINPNFCRKTIENKFNIHKVTLQSILNYKNWKNVA